MGSLHPTHLFALGLGSELGLGVDFVRIRTTLSLFFSLCPSLSFFYNSLQENPFLPSPRTLSENKTIFFVSKSTQLSHNTHTHTLFVSLCFQTHFRTKFPRLKTEYSVFSRWRSKIKKPLFGKSSPRIGESWYNTSFFFFVLLCIELFLLFSSIFSSGSAQCALFYFNWVQVVLFFFFFLLFDLNFYGFDIWV